MEEQWKASLLAALVKRNALQSNCFRPLMQQQDILRKSQAALLEHRRALESEVAQLKQTNVLLREKNDSRGVHRQGSSSSVSGAGSAEQEARIQQLQEDLTASYKRNSENAQAMLELSAQIQEVQANLAKREDDIVQLKLDLERSQDHCTKYKNALKDLQVTKRVLQEELQVLQVEYVKMEEQHTKLGVDYNELLDRWMKKANSDADKVNVANEFYNNMLKMQRNTELLQQAGGAPASEHASSSAAARQYSSLAERVPATPRKTISAHRGEINTCTYDSTGAVLATGSGDKTVRLWDTNTGANRLTLSGAGQAVMCVKFSSSGEFILGASNDNASRLWSTKTGRVRHTFTGHIGKVYSAAFSQDSKKIVTGSHDRTLKVWDLTKGYCMRTIFCFSSCNDLCLTADNARIVSGHLDGNVRFWDAAQGECSHVLSGVHTKQVTSVSLSSDGNFLLSASRDNTLKVVDMRTYEVLHSLEDELYRSGINWSRACFSPMGNYAAAGSADGSVVVWNVQKGTTEKVLEGTHQRTVSCVAWSPNGEQLTSCDRNGSIALWGI